jgi:hypothetical protein
MWGSRAVAALAQQPGKLPIIGILGSDSDGATWSLLSCSGCASALSAVQPRQQGTRQRPGPPRGPKVLPDPGLCHAGKIYST